MSTLADIVIDIEKIMKTFEAVGEPLTLSQLTEMQFSIAKSPLSRTWYSEREMGNLEISLSTNWTHFNPESKEMKMEVTVDSGERIFLYTEQFDGCFECSIEIGELSNQLREDIQRKLLLKLSKEQGFLWYEDFEGQVCCPTKLLPLVSEIDVEKAAASLDPNLQKDNLTTRTPQELLQFIWGDLDLEDSQSKLKHFALSHSLSTKFEGEFIDLKGVWALRDAWEKYISRDRLTIPVMQTKIQLPQEVSPSTLEEELQQNFVKLTGYQKSKEATDSLDLESWREKHPTEAEFILYMRHVYERWFPITKEVFDIFPPFKDASQQEVSFSCDFSVGRERHSKDIKVIIDRVKKAIWLPFEMNEFLQETKTYPGAKLLIKAYSEIEYGLFRKKAQKSGNIKVWDISNGNKLINVERPLYEIDDTVFIDESRFFDTPALFKQAIQADGSIFGLMYEYCVQRWKEEGEEVWVKVDELLKEVSKKRATTEQTIRRELRRRLAFRHEGGQYFLFEPKFGAKLVESPKSSSVQATKRFSKRLDKARVANLRKSNPAYRVARANPAAPVDNPLKGKPMTEKSFFIGYAIGQLLVGHYMKRYSSIEDVFSEGSSYGHADSNKGLNNPKEAWERANQNIDKLNIGNLVTYHAHFTMAFEAGKQETLKGLPLNLSLSSASRSAGQILGYNQDSQAYREIVKLFNYAKSWR